MKRFLCWLTGGHKCKIKDCFSTHYYGKRILIISYRCIKCGKKTEYIVDADKPIGIGGVRDDR